MLLDVGGEAANIQQHKKYTGGEAANIPPPEGEYHLWLIDLAAAATDLDALWQTLSPDEQARAERLRVPLASERFVAARGALRATLARYTGVAPAALRFRYGPAGKPSLDGPLSDAISFNLAHSDRLALLAVSSGGARVGVDIELVGDADHEMIASRFFAPAERRALDDLPPDQRRGAFYRCWVCKEAFVKARGEGLALALDQFTVGVAPGAPAALLHIEGDPDEAGRWRLAALTPAEGFVAALCLERHEQSKIQDSAPQ